MSANLRAGREETMRMWMVLVALVACGGQTDGNGDDTDKADDTDQTVDTDTQPPADDTDEQGETDAEETDDTEDTRPPGDPCRVDPAEIQAGTGESAFVPLSAGQQVKMVYGPQGGWHIWGGLLARNVSSLAVLDFSITDVATGVIVHQSHVNIGMLPLVGTSWACEGTYAGLLGVLGTADLTGDPLINPPVALCGREVELRYKLHHPTGDEMGEGSVRIIAQPDDAHGPSCETPVQWPLDATM